MTDFQNYQKQAEEMQLMGLKMAEQMMSGKKEGQMIRDSIAMDTSKIDG